mmetsp:Transcript_11750/g.21484  ORF Transcript_11750/g.21484 Transcript_11750/m.21484 type:complete len:229 (-) Transcript_11750:17-703(-)
MNLLSVLSARMTSFRYLISNKCSAIWLSGRHRSESAQKIPCLFLGFCLARVASILLSSYSSFAKELRTCCSSAFTGYDTTSIETSALHTGQLDFCWRARLIHSLQKVWPQFGVVIGSYSIRKQSAQSNSPRGIAKSPSSSPQSQFMSVLIASAGLAPSLGVPVLIFLVSDLSLMWSFRSSVLLFSMFPFESIRSSSASSEAFRSRNEAEATLAAALPSSTISAPDAIN